jgi:hypothetical protein
MYIPTDYLQAIKTGKKERSERSMLLNDIYNLYDSEQETKLRKMDNIKRYKAFLRNNRERNTPDAQQRFMKSAMYRKKLEKNRFWFFVSHIPTKDLYFILSVCRDRHHLGRSIGAYIMWLRK